MSKKLVFLIFGCVVLAMTYQSCGDGFEKHEEEILPSDQIYTTELPFELNRTIVATSSNSRLHEGVNPYSTYTDPVQALSRFSFEIRKTDDASELILEIAGQPELITADIPLLQLQHYLNSTTRMIIADEGQFLIFALHNNNQSVWVGYLAGGSPNAEIQTLLQEEFDQPVLSWEFEDMPVFIYRRSGKESWVVNVNNHIIEIEEGNTNIRFEDCGLFAKAVGRTCAPVQQVCSVTNGSGFNLIDYSEEQRSPVYHNECTNIVCDSGYMKDIEDQCWLSCSEGSTRVGGIDDSQCLQNTISCEVDNGTGEQVLESDGTYGICQVATCNENFTEVDNACIPNEVSCNIANGSGTQTLQQSGVYGNCIANTCEEGFLLRNARCIHEDACQDPNRRSQQTVSFTFPARQNCRWGVGENLGRRNGRMQAIERQNYNISVPAGMKLCGIDLSSTKASFRYDDEFFLMFNNYVIASSRNYTSLNAGQGRQVFDWLEVRGTEARGGNFCFGRAAGDSTCQLPGTDVNGNFRLSFNDGVLDALRGDTNQLQLATLGDDDNGDCSHNGLPMTIEMVIAPNAPPPIVTTPSSSSSGSSSGGSSETGGGSASSQ